MFQCMNLFKASNHLKKKKNIRKLTTNTFLFYQRETVKLVRNFNDSFNKVNKQM